MNNYKNVAAVDWQNEVAGRTGIMQTHNVSAMGGSRKFTYNFGYTYNNDKAIVLNSDYKRHLLNLKSDYRVTEKIRLGVSARYTRTDVYGAGISSEQGSSYSRLHNAVKYCPFLSANQDRDDADPQGELMFQASAIGGVAAEDTKLGYYNGPTVNNPSNKSVNVLPTYFYAFDSTDQCRDVTCAVYNVTADGATKIGQAITAICDGKYRRDWITNPSFSPTNAIQYFGLKWQILRYSDVLLMFAEAENELNGPTAAAYNAVNQVRRRGYGKAIGTVDATVDLPAGLSKTAFFDAIVKERSLELGGEGIRKFDLIRWNLLDSKIATTKTALLAMSTLSAPYNILPFSMYYRTGSTSDDNTYTGGLWANSFYKAAPTATPAGTTLVVWVSAAINTAALSRYATGFVTGISELLPLPQPARDANLNLSQNSGY